MEIIIGLTTDIRVTTIFHKVECVVFKKALPWFMCEVGKTKRKVIEFKEPIFYKEYNTESGRILAIFPSYVDVADLEEAEKELEKEFGKLEKV